MTGNGLFYGMPLLAVTTKKSSHEIKGVALRCPSKIMKSDELIAGKGIPIKAYNDPPKPGLDSIMFKPTAEVTFPFILRSSLAADYVWHAAGLFLNYDALRSYWLYIYRLYTRYFNWTSSSKVEHDFASYYQS